MLKVYFDESGSPDDTAAVVVAGFLASEKQWTEFERNWGDALSHFCVSRLHMREFAHSLGEFRGWKGDENKRRRFLSRLINVIRSRTLHSFADAVLMDDYRKVNQTYYLNEIFKPYTIAARTCVTKISNWAKREGIDESEIALIFEDGAVDKSDLIHRLKADQKTNFTLIKKGDSSALQAADLLAYEHLLANTKISAGTLQYFDQLRHPLKELNKIPNNNGLDWGVYSAHNLEELCTNVKIPRRPTLTSV
jgi:hypothetical protein